MSIGNDAHHPAGLRSEPSVRHRDIVLATKNNLHHQKHRHANENIRKFMHYDKMFSGSPFSLRVRSVLHDLQFYYYTDDKHRKMIGMFQPMT